MKKILCFVLLIYGLNAHAQKHWAINSGGTDNEEAYASTIDSQGNIYTTGYFLGTADFNPQSGTFNLTASSSDIFIQKLDSNGQFLWAKSIGGIGWDAGMHMISGENESIYITGLFEKTVDFDPNAGIRLDTAKGSSDFFVLKLSKDGDYVWHRTLGGKGRDGAYAIGKDRQHAIYLTGYFQDTFDFNPGIDSFKLKSKGMQDVFVLKLDSMGNFIWAKSIGGPGDDEVYSLFVEASGHVLFSGTFKFTADFDPSDSSYILSSNRGRGFVEKINSNGEFIRAKQFGNLSFTSCLFVKSDREGNVYATGNFSNMGDFNPDTTTNYITSSGLSDAFIVKLDSMGKFIWVKRFGGIGNDQGMCLEIDTNGGVYLSGSYESKIDLDPGIGDSSKSNRGGRDIFFVHLDKQGNYLWSKAIGGTNNDYCYSIQMDLNQNIITSGSFGDSVYFEPKQGTDFLLSAGLGDIFIQKNFAKGDLIIKPSSLIDMHSQNFGFIVSNPFGHLLSIEFNQLIEHGYVRLYDLRGLKVFDKHCAQTNRLEFANDLDRGVYILELQIGEVIERRKLMRE